uniref:Uncharacterized protein n=1 Tax=Knipowitschia caucasica TaxID=637954 RepID=A0AAV2MJN1_KNICA
MLTSKASTHLKTNPRVIHRPNEVLYHKWGLWQRGRGHRLAPVVLGTAVGVSSAALIQSLHTGTFAAMPLKVDLNSAEGDWKASKDFLLSLEDKRPYYRTSKYVPLDDIPVWTPAAGAEQSKYPRNPNLASSRAAKHKGQLKQATPKASHQGKHSSKPTGG